MRVASLSGSLAGIDLDAIFGLLESTRQTGCLRVAHGRWSAQVLFDRGRPVGASFGDAHGLAALEALVLALPHGRFEFVKDGAGGGHDLVGDPATITAFLERLRALRQRLGLPRHFLDAMPQQVESAPGGPAGAGRIALERHLLLTLGAADGRRTVEEIANLRGTASAVVEVAALVEMGLVRLKSPQSPARLWLAREGRSWLRPAALALLAVLLLGANAWHERRAALDPIPAVAAEVPEPHCVACTAATPATVRVPNAVPQDGLLEAPREAVPLP